MMKGFRRHMLRDSLSGESWYRWLIVDRPDYAGVNFSGDVAFMEFNDNPWPSVGQNEAFDLLRAFKRKGYRAVVEAVGYVHAYPENFDNTDFNTTGCIDKNPEHWIRALSGFYGKQGDFRRDKRWKRFGNIANMEAHGWKERYRDKVPWSPFGFIVLNLYVDPSDLVKASPNTEIATREDQARHREKRGQIIESFRGGSMDGLLGAVEEAFKASGTKYSVDQALELAKLLKSCVYFEEK